MDFDKFRNSYAVNISAGFVSYAMDRSQPGLLTSTLLENENNNRIGRGGFGGEEDSFWGKMEEDMNVIDTDYSK